MGSFSSFRKFLAIVLRERREKWYVAAVIVFRIVFHGLMLLVPLLLGFVVDRLIPQEDIFGLRVWLLVSIAVVIFSCLYLALVANYLFSRFDAYTAAKVQSSLMGKFFRLKPYDFAKHSDGKLLNILGNDHADAVNMVYLFVSSGIISLVSLAAMLLIIFGISPVTAIVAFASLPFYVWAMFANNARVQHWQKERYAMGDKRQTIKRYIVDNMRQIKFSGLGKTATSRSAPCLFLSRTWRA